jgi:hypothetical protein
MEVALTFTEPVLGDPLEKRLCLALVVEWLVEVHKLLPMVAHPHLGLLRAQMVWSWLKWNRQFGKLALSWMSLGQFQPTMVAATSIVCARRVMEYLRNVSSEHH